MCCRRNRGARAARGPAIVILGKMVYDKYQEHKAEKRGIARGSSPDPNYGRLSSTSFSDEANNEILEKAGIAPPSYQDVIIANRAVMADEPTPQIAEKALTDELDRDDLSDAESFFEFDDGVRMPSAHMAAAQASFVQSWRGNEHTCTPRMSKCEQKKLAKAARKAEKKSSCGSRCY